MQIIVAGNFEASSQFAHAINTVKMAQGFACIGNNQVSILCYRATNGKTSREELSEIYGLSENINWIQLPNHFRNNKFDGHWDFARLALPVVLWKRPHLLFARNYVLPYASSRCGIRTVAESHNYHSDNAEFSFLVKASRFPSFRQLGTISQKLVDIYHSLGIPREKLYALPNGVDLNLFSRPESLPPSPYQPDTFNVVYSGHLYDTNGIPTLLKAASKLPDAKFHFVGGWPDDIARHCNTVKELGLNNVTFYGMQPQKILPPFIWHANVLVIPYSKHLHNVNWVVPTKFGEYLISGVPIVLSDIPGFREWLTDEEVEFVTPDDPTALVEGIIRVQTDKNLMERRRVAGLRKGNEMSYKRRAETILNLAGFPIKANHGQSDSKE